MKKIIAGIILITFMSCNDNSPQESKTKPVQLITLDPGHFHAALVQKSMYGDVDSIVHVYAPAGNDVQLHLDRIDGYNSRQDDPAHWKEIVYTGDDFFEKMLQEKKGNVVVLAGNNKRKAEYILRSLENGFNVLADKPMVIDSNGFQQLKQAFDVAAKNNLILYDIMTERFEINSILLREISAMPEVFGVLEKGTAGDPAVYKSSVHYLYKYVSGNVLTRPAWFMDVSQQGEGIADVMTHLVDLSLWECFPNQAIDYTKEVQVNSAKHWPTDITLSQFKQITKTDSFPAYLQKDIANDSVLKMYCNGEISYQVNGVHIKTIVTWQYKAPEGTGDTYETIMRGTKANLVIRQGGAEEFQPVLYIVPAKKDEVYDSLLVQNFRPLQTKYPGIELKKLKEGWQVIIPEKYKEGHEAHFGRVTQNFLEYLKNKNMPDWEVPNMLAKYYITTKALDLSQKNK